MSSEPIDPTPQPVRKRKSRWDLEVEETQPNQNEMQSTTSLQNGQANSTTLSSSLSGLPGSTMNNNTNPAQDSSSTTTPQKFQFSLLVSPLPHELYQQQQQQTQNDTIQPLTTTTRQSRWTIANEQRELELQDDLNPLHLAKSMTIAGPIGFSIPSTLILKPEERERIAILHNQIDDLYHRGQNPTKSLQRIPERDRSPSPEPTYDMNGNRLNTREQRFTQLCQKTRNKLIEEMMKIIPTYQIVGYKKERPYRDIRIPIDEHPAYNFSGLIIGPRGVTHQQMEQDYQCKVSIRGRLPNDVKPKKNEWSNDPPHVHVEGENEELVIQCANAVEKLLALVNCADENNEIKNRQLMELSRYNGSLAEVKDLQNKQLQRAVKHQRSITNYSGPGVECDHCGMKNHLTIDCPYKDTDFQHEYDQHEASMMVGYEYMQEQNKSSSSSTSSSTKSTGSTFEIGGILDLSSAPISAPSRPPRNNDYDRRRNNNNNNMNPMNNNNNPNKYLGGDNNTNMNIPPPNMMMDQSNTINNNNNMNPMNNNMNNNKPLVGDVLMTPNGPMVMTPSGPMPVSQMAPPQILQLHQIIVSQRGIDNPFSRTLIQMGINIALLQQMMQIQQQQLTMTMMNQNMNQNNNINQNNNNINQNNNPNNTNPSHNSNNNTNTNQQQQQQPQQQEFKPPTPPGVNDDDSNDKNNNNNDTNNNNTNSPNNVQQQQSQQPPQPPLTEQQIQEIYVLEYQNYWRQYRQQHGKEPTQDEWYAYWQQYLMNLQQKRQQPQQQPPPPPQQSFKTNEPLNLSTNDTAKQVKVEQVITKNSAFADYMKSVQ